jgi:ABC-2 type transport system permease protein
MDGTGALVRAHLRRDRLRIAIWVGSLALLTVVTVSSTKSLYPTQASLDAAAAISNSAVAVAFNGPPVALDTIGGQVAFQLGAFGISIVALMAILTMSRLTRAEEEAGRLELVRALPIGRRAPLVSALVVAGGMCIAVGGLSIASLAGAGLPVAGSVLLGSSQALGGLVFVGVTALTAQVTENRRVASGLAGAALAVAYTIRAVGDIGSGALSWLSPVGIAQKERPYAGDAWWPLALLLVLAAALVAVAVRIVDRRDLGAGVLPPRPGPATAGPDLAGTTGLAWRLQRGGQLWWAVGVAALAATYGSLTGSLDDFVTDENIADFVAAGPGSLVDAFFATSLLVLAMLATAAALQAIVRVRSEETAGRAEVVLSTPSARRRWLGDHVAIALTGAAAIQLASGLSVGALAAITHEPRDLLRATLASLAYVPAIWVVAGVGVLLAGVAPRWTALTWAPLGFCFVVGMFGSLLDLPQAVKDLSPFQLTPAVPGAPLDAVPIVVLLVVAAALVLAGLAGFERRDVTS